MGAIDLSIERAQMLSEAKNFALENRERRLSLEVLNHPQIGDCKCGTSCIKEHPFLLRKFIFMPCGQKEVTNTGRVRGGFTPSF